MLTHLYVNDWELYFVHNVADVKVNTWQRGKDKASIVYWLTAQNFCATSLVLQQNNTIRNTRSKKLNLQRLSLKHSDSWLVVIRERHSEIYINFVSSDVYYELRLNSKHCLCCWHQNTQTCVYCKVLHLKRYGHMGNKYVSFFSS